MRPTTPRILLATLLLLPLSGAYAHQGLPPETDRAVQFWAEGTLGDVVNLTYDALDTARGPGCFGAVCRGEPVLQAYDMASLIWCVDWGAIGEPCPVPSGHQPNPGRTQCVWGASNWCFQADDVTALPGSLVGAPGCYNPPEAVRESTTFTSRMPLDLAAQVGPAFGARWEVYNPDRLLVSTGRIGFYEVSPGHYQTLAALPGHGVATLGGCDELAIIPERFCTSHCRATWVRYV